MTQQTDKSASQEQPISLSYKDAGVDIDAGDLLVKRIKSITEKTKRPEVMGGIGGFAALTAIPPNYKEPILVSGSDGVGTKLAIAQALNKHDTIGIDLVAMCVNDLIVTGAEPLFFQDYYATGKLNVDTAAAVVTGIGAGCEQAGCSLVGGETAEMPGMYNGEEYDLAGFCVGIVEKSEIIDGSNTQVGDVLIGLASSGPHSNGYSLIRKIIDVKNIDLSSPFEHTTLGHALLEPTRIYVKSLLSLRKSINIKAMAHITGGGLLENVPRVLPDAAKAVFDLTRAPLPPIFKWLQEQGNINHTEMYRTFNCGIGMVVCVPADEAEQAVVLLNASGETATIIGEIQAKNDSEAQVILNGLA